jgi:hypothetical protein
LGAPREEETNANSVVASSLELHDQGDQMSFQKIAQNVAQPIFFKIKT